MMMMMMMMMMLIGVWDADGVCDETVIEQCSLLFNQ